MIVPPGTSHTFGTDVVWYDVAVVSEPLLAEWADTLLSDDLPVEELPHLAIGAKFPVSPWMERVVNAADAHLALAPFLWDLLSSAAEVGAVDRAELIATESHDFSPECY